MALVDAKGVGRQKVPQHGWKSFEKLSAHNPFAGFGAVYKNPIIVTFIALAVDIPGQVNRAVWYHESGAWLLRRWWRIRYILIHMGFKLLYILH